jgi:hypothetical protein
MNWRTLTLILSLMAFMTPMAVAANPSDEFLLKQTILRLKYKEDSDFNADLKRWSKYNKDQLEKEKKSERGGLSVPILDFFIRHDSTTEIGKKFREAVEHGETAAWHQKQSREVLIEVIGFDKDALNVYKAIREAEEKAKLRGMVLLLEPVGKEEVKAILVYYPQEKNSPKQVKVVGLHPIGLSEPSKDSTLVKDVRIDQLTGKVGVFKRLKPNEPCSLAITFDELLPVSENLAGGKPLDPCPIQGLYEFQEQKNSLIVIKCTKTVETQSGIVDKVEIYLDYAGPDEVHPGEFDRTTNVLSYSDTKGKMLKRTAIRKDNGVIWGALPEQKSSYWWNPPGKKLEK